jgi:hypothetical protein
VIQWAIGFGKPIPIKKVVFVKSGGEFLPPSVAIETISVAHAAS